MKRVATISTKRPKTRPNRRLTAVGTRACLLVVWLVTSTTVACGEPTDEPSTQSKDATDTGSAGRAKAKFGEGCKSNTECPPGQFCMQSEFTPTAFCTAFCDAPKDYCELASVGGANALCVEMPGVWTGPTRTVCDEQDKCEKRGRPFCAPVCSNTSECTASWKSWEQCSKPAYKNVPLYNDLPTKVCMAPASHGQIVVDPQSCQWEDKITDPKVQEAKQLCKAHCDFLTTCQLFDPKQEAASCCTWRCFQKMTPEGRISQDRKEEIKCYIKAFSAARGTPKVCELYKEQCPNLEHPRG